MRKRGHTASHSSSLGCWVSEPQLKSPLILAAFLDVLKCPSSGQGGEPELQGSPQLLVHWSLRERLPQGQQTRGGCGASNLTFLVCLMGKKHSPKASTAVEIRASEGFLDLSAHLVSGQSSDKLPPPP